MISVSAYKQEAGGARPVVSRRFDDLGADGVPRRLGIMGGTFDPIHIGHLACAEQAREAFGLDAVVFVVAGTPAFKRDKRVTPAAERLEMCAAAVASNPHFDASSIEVDRPGVTYTADTLRELRAHYPDNVELWFITGADAVCSILKWRESEVVARLAHIVALTRPGWELDDEKRRVIEERGAFRVHMLQATGLAVSSTDLRQRVSQGRSIRYLTMQRVLDYISEHGLYRLEAKSGDDVGVSSASRPAVNEDVLSEAFFEARKNELSGRVKPKRFKHSLGVSDTAGRMAAVYGCDERLARLAGLLHDWDKGYDDAGIVARACELGLAEEYASYLDMPHLLHGPTASVALARAFPGLPEELLRAIRLHTTGDVGMTCLDMIIYVADAIEPARDYPGVDELRAMAGVADIEELFLATFQHVLGNLVSRRKRIHPDTVKVWNHYAVRSRKRAAAEKEKGNK